MRVLDRNDDLGDEQEAGGVVAFGFRDVCVAGNAVRAVPQAVLGHDLYYAPVWAAASVGFSGVPDWLDGLAGQVGELSTLRPGWDGHRGLPIDHGSLRKAWELLLHLTPWVQVPPSLVPTSTGGVVLEWHRGGIDLEVQFPPKGDAEVSFESEAGDEFDGPLDQWAAHLPIVISTIE